MSQVRFLLLLFNYLQDTLDRIFNELFNDDVNVDLDETNDETKDETKEEETKVEVIDLTKDDDDNDDNDKVYDISKDKERINIIHNLWKNIDSQQEVERIINDEERKRIERNARKREIRRFKKLYPGLPVPRKQRTPENKRKMKEECPGAPKKQRQLKPKDL